MDRMSADGPSAEEAEFLSRQLITCIGNKRALLGPVGDAVARVKRRLGKERLRIFDAFAGSGVVSRLFKGHAENLVSNDLEEYAAVIGRCHLRDRNSIDRPALTSAVAELNTLVDSETLAPGFFTELYAPRDEAAITRADRVFYTRDNARRLDDYRRRIAAAPAGLRDLLLGPLLSAASVHANTAGVFKGFYKDRRTGLGRFGGSGADALKRIRGVIRLEEPVLSRFGCEADVRQGDANAVARTLKGLDLAYFDPPYNQHPYGSNYFMLNLVANYRRPAEVSPVSGIPADWRRSGYNVRSQSVPLLRDLIAATDAPFVLISFNDEGFISRPAMESLLAEFGRVEVVATPYTAFRGSRNFLRRPVRVTELLYLVERG